MIYLPEPLGAFLDDLRLEMVPGCNPHAHVSVLPPRPLPVAPEAAIEEARGIVAGFAPFEIQLGGIEKFDVTDVIYISVERAATNCGKCTASLNQGALAFGRAFRIPSARDPRAGDRGRPGGNAGRFGRAPLARISRAAPLSRRSTVFVRNMRRESLGRSGRRTVTRRRRPVPDGLGPRCRAREPQDPRVYLAAERTFLAWIRTGLALMGFGFVVARFGLFLREIEFSQHPLVAVHSVEIHAVGGHRADPDRRGRESVLGAAAYPFHPRRQARREVVDRPVTMAVVIALILAVTGVAMTGLPGVRAMTRRALLASLLLSHVRAAGAPGLGSGQTHRAGERRRGIPFRGRACPNWQRSCPCGMDSHCTVLYAIDPTDGTIKPDLHTNIPGLEALDSADLMVMLHALPRLARQPDEAHRGLRGIRPADRGPAHRHARLRSEDQPHLSPLQSGTARNGTAVSDGRCWARPGSTTTASTASRVRAASW